MQIAFNGKRILVVGAARGIGQAIVRAFATRGGRVAAADLMVDPLRDLAGPDASGGDLAKYMRLW